MPSITLETTGALRTIRATLAELEKQGGSITDVQFWAASQQAWNVPAKRVLVAAMRAAAPVRTGGLRKSINRRNFPARYRNRRRKRAGVVVGPDYKMGGSHAHLVEFGHGGPKPAPPHPFIDEAVNAAESRLRSEHGLRLEKSINRLVDKTIAKIKANGG